MRLLIKTTRVLFIAVWQTIYSPFNLRISFTTSLDILKFVKSNLSIKGLTFGIIDICLALWIIPSVPVVLNINFLASLRAFKSSNKSKTSSNSEAKAKALASPRST